MEGMPEEATPEKKKSKKWWLEFIQKERALAKKRKAKKAAKARGEVRFTPGCASHSKVHSANIILYHLILGSGKSG